jgi:hypothetical protein
MKLGRLRGCRGMRAEFSCKSDEVKVFVLPTCSMLSTDSLDMMSKLSHVKLTLLRCRMAEVENGIGKLTAGRSDSLVGEEATGLRARIVEPALAAQTLLLLDGIDVSLMVDLDLCFVLKALDEVCAFCSFMKTLR